MKNLLWGCMATFALGFASCRETADNQILAQMNEQIAAAETAVAETETLGQSLQTLADQLELAPAELKSDTASRFDAVYQNITGFQGKYSAAGAEQADLLDRLKTLSADYAAGKIKTGEVKKEYTLLQQSLEKVMARTADYRAYYDQASSEYARMMADFKARAEGD